MTAANALMHISDADGEQRIHITQGQFYVTSAQNVVLTTTLGSCVSACIFDADARLGGMNHFLLAEGGEDGSITDAEALRYGAYAMELLVNGLLRAGARREKLEARLFGGARLTERLADIGGHNVEFAESFLRREGIGYHGGSVRGEKARRLQFWPASGRVRQLALARTIDAGLELERSRALIREGHGTPEFFES